MIWVRLLVGLLRLIQVTRPRTGPPEKPVVEVDEATRRLLAAMTAVGLQVFVMISFIAFAQIPPWATLMGTAAVGVYWITKMRRRPFERLPALSIEKPGDAEYWRSTRRLFVAAQVMFFVLGAAIVALVSGNAGRPATELALRLSFHSGLAGFFAFAYRVP